ncbi:PilW family protein [Zooshikella ganghwensis]|uniref:Prepilin-type N-terminal cleavage/methylation domain-containing protein n=1 Tax=Zooshikella ganghwensis TaxID=202772 RepID=A0A4P9VTF0_9GAMM|nr:PilW family protein [Zooshikella ganghwensis]RDH45522.1 prepilin-type N-terminal cleavage/methylation domain-containing protein [Zooshikella ganghwensis]
MLLNKQSGLSLIELMIALVLGLLLLAGVLQVFLGSSQTYRLTGDLARAQENGRFALDMLARDIRMAGYRNPDRGELIDFFIVGSDCPNTEACTVNVSGTTESDTIAVQLDPEENTDCLGSSVGADDIVINIYSVRTQPISGVNISSLFCRGWNVTTGAWSSPSVQPLVDGIENMQILYGIAPDEKFITRYVTADNVPDWNKIRAVRIGLLVSAGNVTGAAESKKREYIILDSGGVSFTDRQARYVYTTTVNLNNSLTDQI